MRRLAFLVALLTLSPFSHVRADAHGACDCKGCPGLSIYDIAGIAYIDDRNYAQGNGLWIYLESNNITGLQRGGSSILIPNDNEVCYDDSANGPDTLVF